MLVPLRTRRKPVSRVRSPVDTVFCSRCGAPASRAINERSEEKQTRVVQSVLGCVAFGTDQWYRRDKFVELYLDRQCCLWVCLVAWGGFESMQLGQCIFLRVCAFLMQKVMSVVHFLMCTLLWHNDFYSGHIRINIETVDRFVVCCWYGIVWQFIASRWIICINIFITHCISCYPTDH